MTKSLSNYEFTAVAPANIALIKYMGKEENTRGKLYSNIPINPSISLSLPHLYTRVHLKYSPEYKKDFWMMHPDAPKLSHVAVTRFIDHLQYIKEQNNFQGNFAVYGYNNFPMSTGVASSASSFAALTRCAYSAIYSIEGIDKKNQLTNEQMAMVSRVGSGSSCRSFFYPWAIWEKDRVFAKSYAKYDKLDHVLLVVSRSQKHISSSKAHSLVQTSGNFKLRMNNVKKRFMKLNEALEEDNWKEIFNLVWDEFIEVHKLFHTSKPSFSYCDKNVMKILERLHSWWDWHEDGPLVTMDAGPNIHLLFRQDQRVIKKRIIDNFKDIEIISS